LYGRRFSTTADMKYTPNEMAEASDQRHVPADARPDKCLTKTNRRNRKPVHFRRIGLP